MRQLSLLWAGVIIGCSFLATPVKFMAPDLTLPVALEIGRLTFRAVGLAELIFSLVAIVLVGLRRTRMSALVPVFVLAIQWLLVMPMLDAQTASEMSSGRLGALPWHTLFVVLEVLKLAALLAIGFDMPPKKLTRRFPTAHLEETGSTS